MKFVSVIKRLLFGQVLKGL